MKKRNIEKLLDSSKKSILLIGPRQTGKSTLMRALGPDLSINLMYEKTFLEFAANPEELEQRLQPEHKLVFIDEIQRLPSLLNTIQVLIDEADNPPRFLLTGLTAVTQNSH